MDQKTDKPMMRQIRELGLNKELVFPVERMTSVKSTVSQVGVIENKVFTTSINRKERTIKVTRIS